MSITSLINLLFIPLSWLALPVILIVLYDKFVLEPERPRQENGEPEEGPLYVRIAGYLLPLVIVAAAVRVGVSEVFGWAKEIAVPLSWAAVPIGLWCAIDSWLLARSRSGIRRCCARPTPCCPCWWSRSSCA
jgi:hypothetical protein